jgi:sugar O-acyltransferase (sialic acid O-acetyltransferase NeuD family)
MKTNEAINKIAIFGAGGQGREVLQLIQQINRASPQWECIGWFDDGLNKGDQVSGLPVLGGMKEANSWPSPLALVVAIAWPSTKEKIVSLLHNDQLYYPVLIHPSVRLEEPEVQIGKGTIITQNCCFTINIKIGEFVLLNSGCTITHDVIIGNYASVMPAVIASGAVHIEDSVYIGAGTQIIQQLRLGLGSIIGAGSVVIRDIPAHCTAVGVPAKPIKFHNEIKQGF